MTTSLLSKARASVRASLTASHITLLAVGMAAGLSAEQARAWGNNYEYLGRTVGSELGRAVAGRDGAWSPAGRIAGLAGEMVGASVARPFDQAAEDQRRADQEVQRAREQAQRDNAYEAERRRLDPNYTGTRYSEMADRGARSLDAHRAIANNVSALNEENERLVRDYQRRNAQRVR